MCEYQRYFHTDLFTNYHAHEPASTPVDCWGPQGFPAGPDRPSGLRWIGLPDFPWLAAPLVSHSLIHVRKVMVYNVWGFTATVMHVWENRRRFIVKTDHW